MSSPAAKPAFRIIISAVRCDAVLYLGGIWLILNVESENSRIPVLPDLATGGTFVVKYIAKTVVICIEGCLLFVKVPWSVGIAVHVLAGER